MQHHDIEAAIHAYDQLEAALTPRVAALSGNVAATVGQTLSIIKHHRNVLGAELRALGAAGPKRHRLTKGEVRLLFTNEERDAETIYYYNAKKAFSEGTATENQKLYLRMREDFDAAAHVDLDDPAVVATFGYFYVMEDLLTSERAAYALTGYRPGEMPEPEGDDEGDEEV